PTSLTPAVREAIASCQVDESGPAIDRDWGEPGLSPEERVWGWNCFTVRAFEAGDTEKPQNAVPPWAVAHVQLRFVVGTDEADIVPALRRHLDREGFEDVEVIHEGELAFRATRLDPDAPWAVWAAASLERTLGAPPAVLPNLGGSLPNDVFTDGLGLPTIWVPHGHPACSQHAPNEHLLASIAEEGLGMMAGLWWDLGERAGAAAPPPPR
ncbi:MAG: M20 peptidase family dipeptidase, partial [Pseudomonadota bacterium]